MLGLLRNPKILMATALILLAVGLNVVQERKRDAEEEKNATFQREADKTSYVEPEASPPEIPEIDMAFVNERPPEVTTRIPQDAMRLERESTGAPPVESPFLNPEGERGLRTYERDIASIGRFIPPEEVFVNEATEPPPPRRPVRMIHGDPASYRVPDEPPPEPDQVDPIEKSPESRTLDLAFDGSYTYAPYGRLLRCRLVNTVESFDARPPIIGLVTHPLEWNGRVVIPAGSEVHGTALPDTARGRILTAPEWRIILPQVEEKPVGTELRIRGIGLNRAVDETGLRFGVSDGTLGLDGFVIRDTRVSEIKLFLATALAAVASGLENRETNTLTGTTFNATSSRNAALQGISAVMDEYARQIQEEIERNGIYVQVPAGREFYVYIQHTVLQEASDIPLPPDIPSNQEFLLWEAAFQRRLKETAEGDQPVSETERMLQRIREASNQ